MLKKKKKKKNIPNVIRIYIYDRYFPPFSPYLSLDTVQFGYQYLLPVTLETGQGFLSSQLFILHLSQRFCP